MSGLEYGYNATNIRDVLYSFIMITKASDTDEGTSLGVCVEEKKRTPFPCKFRTALSSVPEVIVFVRKAAFIPVISLFH